MKPERKPKKQIESKKKSNSTLIIGAIIVIVLAGIAYAVFSGNSANTSNNAPKSQIKLPSYAYTNPLTLKGYQYATQHPDILEQIPCYCGCGGHSGHRFLRDCFIKDDRSYDEHASFCDVCVGETIKVQEYLASGKTLREARALIDQEYGSKYPEGRTNTPPVSDSYIPILSPVVAGISTADTTAKADLSVLSLPSNFKSLSDGLKFEPPGIRWAYFVNMKQETGFERTYITGDDFYGFPVIGMLNSEYSQDSWVELHDIGKTNAQVTANIQPNADNIVYTRPFVFATKDKTSSVLSLIADPTKPNAYDTFKILLEKVDDENAGFAKVNTKAPSFSDMSYFGLVKAGTDVKGEIAFNIADAGKLPMTKYNDLKNSSATRGFKSYIIEKDNTTLIIKMTSDLNKIVSEATQYYEIEK